MGQWLVLSVCLRVKHGPEETVSPCSRGQPIEMNTQGLRPSAPVPIEGHVVRDLEKSKINNNPAEAAAGTDQCVTNT